MKLTDFQKSLFFLVLFYLIYISGFFLSRNESLAFMVPGWVITGVSLWGLWTLGHDALHGAISESKNKCEILGNLAFLPTLFPYYTAKAIHLKHHAHLSNIFLDTAWRPWSVDEYTGSLWYKRMLYKFSRHPLGFGFAPFLMIIANHFDTSIVPNKTRSRAKMAMIGSVIVVSMHFAAFFWEGELIRNVLSFAFPYLIFGWIFSTITFMQHTHVNFPSKWVNKGNGLSAPEQHTIDYKIGFPFELVFVNGNIHSPHHKNPKIPFFQLRRIAKKQNLTFEHLGFSDLLKTLKCCQLIEPKTGEWVQITNIERSFGAKEAKAQ